MSWRPGMSRTVHVCCSCSFVTCCFPRLRLSSQQMQAAMQFAHRSSLQWWDRWCLCLGEQGERPGQCSGREYKWTDQCIPLSLNVRGSSRLFQCCCVRALELQIQMHFWGWITDWFCLYSFPPLLLTARPVRKKKKDILIEDTQMSRENLGWTRGNAVKANSPLLLVVSW